MPRRDRSLLLPQSSTLRGTRRLAPPVDEDEQSRRDDSGAWNPDAVDTAQRCSSKLRYAVTARAKRMVVVVARHKAIRSRCDRRTARLGLELREEQAAAERAMRLEARELLGLIATPPSRARGAGISAH
jgi:hypothetical protein